MRPVGDLSSPLRLSAADELSDLPDEATITGTHLRFVAPQRTTIGG
jgi:hypothetical protein